MGMSAAEIFRDAELLSASDGNYSSLADAVEVSLREKSRFRRLEARYALRPAKNALWTLLSLRARARRRGIGRSVPDL